jgi:hypothetical protein
MSRTSIPSRCIAVVLLLLTALPATTFAAEAEARADEDGPRIVLQSLTLAYEARNVEAYAALLSEDFRFHFGDEEQRASYPDGWGRADELASATHLFISDPARPDRPCARRIRLSIGATTILPDPEFPCDRAHHALIDAPQVVLEIELVNGQRLSAGGHHAFRAVQGDDGAWRIRRWDEEPADSLLAAAACADTAVAVAVGADSPGPKEVATNRLWSIAPNPSRLGGNATLTFAVEQDGDAAYAALYDVAGRRVRVLAHGPSAAGIRTLSWDGRDTHGTLTPAGVYFLHLRAGERTWRERVVRVP